MSFASFRNRLDTASGFQSAQFRELEFLLGYKRGLMLQHLPQNSEEHDQLLRRLGSLPWSIVFTTFLATAWVAISGGVAAARPLALPNIGDDAVAAGILHLYRTQPNLQILFELMTDFDEGFQEWRYRHIKLVERTIGSKHGTGGSLGVEFLKKSLFHPLFADLWSIRHQL